VPDAWISEGVREPQDRGLGKVGYEINFNRYFYRYVPPRPLAEIEADIRALEKEIVQMLGEITRSGAEKAPWPTRPRQSPRTSGSRW
jgi:type I restriction enzyme M protein